MWPAVPRIMACSQAAILPHLERAKRSPVGEVFGKELPQQPLMCARRGVVERWRMTSVDEFPQRVARFGGELATRGGETPAAETERATGTVAEHHGVLERQRSVAVGAEVERGRETEFGHDVPGAG